MGLLTESINGVIIAYKPIHKKIYTALLFQPDEIFRQTDTFPNSRCCNYSVLRVSFLQEMSKRALDRKSVV
jgi:hypothetical protein